MIGWVSRVGIHFLLLLSLLVPTPCSLIECFYQFILVSRPSILGWQSPKALLALEEVFQNIKSLRDLCLG